MKVNIIRNRVKGAALILGVAMLFAACQLDEFASMEYAQSEAVVGFTTSVISASADLQTKVSVSEEMSGETTLVSEDGAVSLPLSFRSTPGIGGIDEISAAPATKGTLINDNDNGDLSKIDLPSTIGSFKVAAWTGTSTTASIPAYTNVTYADGKWSTATSYIWKKGETKTFVAYANTPASGTTVSSAAAGTQTLNHTVPADVSEQKDILMGYYSGDGDGSGTAAITFYHPLTAVKFKKGTVSEGVSITGISIEGIYTSGKTTQTSSTGTNFVWTKTDGSDFAATDETGTASLSNVTVDEDGFIGDAIVLIPETFASAKARIAVTLNTPTGAKTLYYPLKGTTFRAGWTNIFTIGYDTATYIFTLEEGETSGNISFDSSVSDEF